MVAVKYGVTVAQVPWARHDAAFAAAFEDLVVHDAVVSSKLACARLLRRWAPSPGQLSRGFLGHERPIPMLDPLPSGPFRKTVLN
jgi:hypothetical protein